MSIVIDLSELETQKIMMETEYVRDLTSVREFADWYNYARLGNRTKANQSRWDAFAAQIGDLDGIILAIQMILRWPQERIDNLTPWQIEEMMRNATSPQSPFPLNFVCFCPFLSLEVFFS